MRISILAMLILAVIFMAANTGCPSGTGTTNTNPPDPQAATGTEDPNTPETPVTPVEEEELYFNGFEPEELLAAWKETGEEDVEGLDQRLHDLDGNYYDLIEWHISEIDWDETDEYQVELTAGDYAIYGWSGAGITDLDMTLLGPGGEEDVLDEDTEVDPYPILLFTLDVDETVTLQVKPFDVEEDVIKANYCWFLVMTEM